MGSLGTTVKKAVDAIINNPSIRSSIAINQITKEAGEYGGYTDSEETETSVGTYGVPAEYMKEIETLRFGDLSHGKSKIVVKAEEILDEETYDYHLVWQNQTWQVHEIERPFINDVVVCQILSLVKHVD